MDMAKEKGMEVAAKAAKRAEEQAMAATAGGVAEANGAASRAAAGATASAEHALSMSQSADPAERAKAQAQLRTAEADTAGQLAAVPTVVVPPGLGLLQEQGKGRNGQSTGGLEGHERRHGDVEVDEDGRVAVNLTQLAGTKARF